MNTLELNRKVITKKSRLGILKTLKPTQKLNDYTSSKLVNV